MVADRAYEVAARHLAERDPVLAPIIEAVGLPGLLPSTNLFGSLASSIVGQQLSVKAAASIRQRLIALMPTAEGLTAEGILACSIDDLRAAGLSRSKAGYVRDLAEKVHEGTVDLTSISALDDEAVITELVKVKGIGRWTAEMFLIFALNRLDVLPVDDLGFRAAVKRQYGLGQLPRAEELRRIGELWRPYRSLGTWYLWQSLRNEPSIGSSSPRRSSAHIKPPTGQPGG